MVAIATDPAANLLINHARIRCHWGEEMGLLYYEILFIHHSLTLVGEWLGACPSAYATKP